MFKLKLIETKYCTVEIGDICMDSGILLLPPKTENECKYYANDICITTCFNLVVIDTESKIGLYNYYIDDDNIIKQGLYSDYNKYKNGYKIVAISNNTDYKSPFILPELSNIAIIKIINYYNHNDELPNLINIESTIIHHDHAPNGFERCLILNEEGKVDIDIELSMTEKLKMYFKVTPREKIIEDWESTKEFDNIKPTIEEFLNKKLNI